MGKFKKCKLYLSFAKIHIWTKMCKLCLKKCYIQLQSDYKAAFFNKIQIIIISVQPILPHSRVLFEICKKRINFANVK